ncbi:MAG: adenylate/guanylate cyclase domain-containing protein [Opitutales bacterium]
MRLPLFRRFSFRLLVLLLGLLFAALASTYLLVSRANETNARSHAEANLELGARIFTEATRQRIDFLAASARLMSGDYAIRQILLADKPDAPTLSSNLYNYTRRVGAPVIAFFDTAGELVANSEADMDNENRGPFRALIRQATRADLPQASGFTYLNHELHVLVVVPLYAPYPEIAGWFGLAFPIDQAFARKIKDTTRLDLTFVSTDDPRQPRVLASTRPDDQARAVAQAVAAGSAADSNRRSVRLLGQPDDRYVSLFMTQDMQGENAITIVLQRPLNSELAAAHDLEKTILRIALTALLVATLAALGIARGVSQPVQALAAHTQHVAAGDYTRRIELKRADELGQLATAFNQMTAGLAERDRVRDLLGKVVSPEIAAQLLQSDLQLGGAERVVTILFSDLRNFTTLSEKLPPAEVLTLLNRYLDRMSAVVERHGGVIDKYIGDAIMALFGAPVASADSAGQALAAARDMTVALAALNAELAAEGRPALAFGIGINTARVVAGNMGSKTRLNYTVIGDGVNLAARLESLTKEPSHAAHIIVSEATIRAALTPPPVRALGTVSVKGKAEPVLIYALDV